MPTFYNFRENGLDYSFDDIFVPADLFREGTLWNWGKETYGIVGNNVLGSFGSIVYTPITTFAGGSNWKQVSCGVYFTSAIKTDGTLWTWGRGNFGQLGNGQITDRATPVTTFAGGTDWKQVSCGYNVAAIKTDGTLWTWGNGGNGQLGNTSTINVSTPITTFAGGTNWKQVSCGFHTVAAIKTDGTLWTWGNGGNGQLGNAQVTNRSTPVTTFAGGTNWKQVGCGFHTAAIKTDGTLWTWGTGTPGQLGNASTINVSTPITTFAGGTNWKQVSRSFQTSAAIKTDGTLWTWGNGGNGQLGNAQVTNRSTPVTTFAGGTNWKQVDTTSTSTSAIKTDGTLWSWGNGYLGAFLAAKSTPITTFAGGTNWKQVSSAFFSTAALTYEDPVI